MRGRRLTRIRVTVVQRRGRKTFQLKITDPSANTLRWQSSEIPLGRRTKAERLAGKLEDELNEIQDRTRVDMPWEEFLDRYWDVAVSGLAKGSRQKISTATRHLERVVTPKWLSDVDSEALGLLAADLRRAGRAEDSIRSVLATLGAALGWAAELELIPARIKIPRVQRAKGRRGGKMKGRPITTEEFERMLAAAPAVVGLEAAESWRHWMWGLWWSGLRLAESLELWWDRRDRLCVLVDGRRPVLWVPGELEKGHRDRILPIAWEFADFLLATPQDERRGPVFRPLLLSGGRCSSKHSGGRRISAMGEHAGVVVERKKTGTKYASAHDFRRAFGTRWAPRVPPMVLMEMMRHESIQTTRKFYLGLEAQDTSEVIWRSRSEGETGPGETTPPTMLGDKLGDSIADEGRKYPT